MTQMAERDVVEPYRNSPDSYRIGRQVQAHWEKLEAHNLLPLDKSELRGLSTSDYLDRINRLALGIVGSPEYRDPENGFISYCAWKVLVEGGILAASFGERDPELRQAEIMYVTRILSAHDLSLGLSFGITTGLAILPLQRFGSESPELQAKYLKHLHDGGMMGLAITERDRSGSSALDMNSHYTRNADGTISLSFEKRHQGLSGHPMIVAATEEGSRRPTKVGLFIVDAKDITTELTAMEGLSGIPYGINTGQVQLDREHLMAELDLRTFQDLFVKSRILFPGMTLGHQDAMLAEAAAYAGTREIGNKKLETLAVPSSRLTLMATRRLISEAIFDRLIEYRKDGVSLLAANTFGDVMEANISKVLTTAYALEAATDRAELMGGMAYLQETGLRDYVDIWPFQIFEGTRLMLESDIGTAYYRRIGEGGNKEHAELFAEAKAKSRLDTPSLERLMFLEKNRVSEVQRAVFGQIICRLFALGCLSETDLDVEEFTLCKKVLNAEIRKLFVDLDLQADLQEYANA